MQLINSDVPLSPTKRARQEETDGAEPISNGSKPGGKPVVGKSDETGPPTPKDAAVVTSEDAARQAGDIMAPAEVGSSADKGSLQDKASGTKAETARRNSRRLPAVASVIPRNVSNGESAKANGDEDEDDHDTAGNHHQLRVLKRLVPEEDDAKLREKVQVEFADLLVSEEPTETAPNVNVQTAKANQTFEDRFLDFLVFKQAYGHGKKAQTTAGS